MRIASRFLITYVRYGNTAKGDIFNGACTAVSFYIHYLLSQHCQIHVGNVSKKDIIVPGFPHNGHHFLYFPQLHVYFDPTATQLGPAGQFLSTRLSPDIFRSTAHIMWYNGCREESLQIAQDNLNYIRTQGRSGYIPQIITDIKAMYDYVVSGEDRSITEYMQVLERIYEACEPLYKEVHQELHPVFCESCRNG